MTRLLKSHIKAAGRRGLAIAEPWITSGKLTASAAIKAAYGVVGGVLVTATDNGGDIDVEIWDSPDATLTNDERICRVTITTTTDKVQASWGSLAGQGVEATLGIYCKVVAGDCEVEVYYK